jgi:EpsI family protein
MRQIDRRHLILALALAAGTGVVALTRPNRRPVSTQGLALTVAALDHVKGWEHVELPDFVLPQQSDLESDTYNAQILKGYRNSTGRTLYCLVAYGAVQDYALQLHSPQICYPSSGFTIISIADLDLILAGRTVPARVLVAKRGRRTETVLYWSRVADSFPQTQWQVRSKIVGSFLSGTLADGLLVRLSTTELEGERAVAELSSFARELASGMTAGAATFVFGA